MRTETLGMPRPVLVLMLKLEALWISAAGTLRGMGAAAAFGLVMAEQGAARRLAHTAPLLLSLCALAAPVLGVTLLAALVPALRAACHDVARGLALIPVHQEGRGRRGLVDNDVDDRPESLCAASG